jgi:signal peptidase I
MMYPDPVSTRAHDVKCELAAEVLRSTGTVRLRVNGWSMLPTVMPGDTLLVESATSDQVAEGEIVLFHRERRFFIHRVVRELEDRSGLLTRGDAMPQSDPPVRRHELLGRILCIERNGKCFAPSPHLTWRERAIAAIAQRSETAARVVVGVHGFRQSPEGQA